MVRVTLRINEHTLYEAIENTAKQNRRSMNAEILRAIEYYLKNAPEAQYQVEDEKPIKKELKKKKV